MGGQEGCAGRISYGQYPGRQGSWGQAQVENSGGRGSGARALWVGWGGEGRCHETGGAIGWRRTRSLQGRQKRSVARCRGPRSSTRNSIVVVLISIGASAAAAAADGSTAIVKIAHFLHLNIPPSINAFRFFPGQSSTCCLFRHNTSFVNTLELLVSSNVRPNLRYSSILFCAYELG